MAPAAGPGWEEPTSQLYPGFLPELDYVFTPKHIGGSAYDGQALLWHTRALLSRTVGTIRVQARRPGIARASREAISLRTLLRAQSLRGHNGIGRTSPCDLISGIRDVGKRYASRFQGRRLAWSLNPRRRCLVAGMMKTRLLSGGATMKKHCRRSLSDQALSSVTLTPSKP